MGILPSRFVRSDPPGGVFQPGRLPGRKCESRDFGVPSGVHEALVKRFVCEASGTCLERSYFTICIDTKTKKMRVCWKNVNCFEVHDVFFDLII